jgi:hypothetical protein
MPKNQIDYSKVFIYKLCCNDISIKDIYVGHTTNFEQRKNSHKRNCEILEKNTRVYKFIRENGGWSNWSMVLIENYDCVNKYEAVMRERYWIENLQANLNCNNPIATKEEKEKQKKDWYEENKEDILQKAKENYEENKEHKLEYQKQYTEQNKEKIKEYQQEYQEQNKEKLAEQKKEYREAHKEELAKKMKEWRESNKEKIKEEKSKIIECECGSQYIFGNKHRHLQTKIHTNYQNQLCGIIEEPTQQLSEEEKLENLRQKQKEYREKNSDKIKENKKIYNENHKQEISDQNKIYYEQHKNEIIEKNKKYTEENKDKVKKNKDEWYQKNKEKILEKQKQIYVCDCGSEVRCAGKAEHNRSTKHKNFIETKLNSQIN